VTLNLKELLIQSVTAPRSVAPQILGLQLSNEILWTMMALVAVLNAILYSLSIFVFETSTGLKTGMNLPFLYLALLGAAMVIGAMVLRWVGQMWGGRATLNDMFAMVVWLQALRAVAQLGLLVLMVVAPGLSNLVAIGLGMFGLWLMANFLDVAQGWNSLGKSIVVLVLTGLGFAFGLSFFMLLIGATAMGI